MSSAAPLTVVAALSLSAFACGGTESSADGSLSPTIEDAVDETLAAETARFTLTFEHTRDEATFGIEAGERESVDGIVDFERHRTASGQSDQVIVDETTFYLQPAAEGDLRWRKYDLSPGAGKRPAPDLTFGRLDVIRQLEYVDSIAGSLDGVGEEEVRGAPATRFAGQGQADALMRALLSDSVYRLLPWSSHAGTIDRSQPVPFDVWVGEDGRVRKVVYDFPDFSGFAGDLTTIELYDYGDDIDIELPEAIDG